MSSTLRMNTTPVFSRNYKSFKDPGTRFIINTGGTRSSKTMSICQLLIYYALTNSNKIVSIVRKSSPALFASVHVDFLGLLHEYNIYKDIAHNKTNAIFVFPNKTEIRFFSVDDPQKLRGRKHDVVFLNEANELSLEDFTQINMRTSDKILIDWNPSDPFSWILDLEKDQKAIKIHSTYVDNPFLPDDIIREIKNLINQDESYYQIYSLGILPLGKDYIFPKIHLTPFPPHLDFVYGMDFGYVDPNTLMKVAKQDNKLYIKEELFESYLTTEELISKMNLLNISKNHNIYADSARPDQISSISNAGYSIQKSNKKIQEGLDFMKTHEIHIDPDSHNTYREFRSYKYKKVRGIATDVPIDFENHTIDAARYATMSMKYGASPSFMVI